MTKSTTELLEKFVSDIKTDGMCDITDHQVESALIRLLAYEQAAEKPYGYLEPCDFPRTTATVYPEKDKYAFMPLYAAPVLPKQPEHSRQHFESLCNQFWNWAEFDEINQDEEPRLEWNGSNYTHRVTAALWKMYQAASAQPVLPKWPSDEVERDALRYRFLRDSDFLGDQDEPGLVGWKELLELGYNELDAAIDARIAHPDIDYVKLDNALRKHIPAQPVSEPYKLPELNDELIEILGRPNFTCTNLAECLRHCGQDIKRKSENEQAAVLHVLLNLYIKHGNDWRKHAEEAFTPAPAQESE